MLVSSRGPFHDRPRYSGTGLSGWTGVVTLTTLVTKTWSPQTTGDPHERPGTSTFHTTLRVRLQLTGSDGWSAARPPCVPRNCGQFSASSGTTGRQESAIAQAMRFVDVMRAEMPAVPDVRPPCVPSVPT